MSEKSEHLQMIQQVIKRFGSNSFKLKGWSVTLVSALFALFAKDANANALYLAYFPAVIFWFLDGYYLRQERLFRHLYNNASTLNEDKIDFSMDTTKYAKDESSWIETCFSWTIVVFHLAVVLSITATVILVYIQG